MKLIVKLSFKRIYFVKLFLFISVSSQIVFSQINEPIIDKCGFDAQLAKISLQTLGDHWGYSYDSLITDIDHWIESPYVAIDSIGASVQKRAIWQLTITDFDSGAENRHTVFIHARTHPGEVQSWWVTDEIIKLLLSEQELAKQLRRNCNFYILPMYNPDGVELEYPRENANGIDIESNWDEDPGEPEVQVLRDRFTELMDSDAPIEIALNMHSAYRCLRYFVYHDQVGTSLAFTEMEQSFIEGIRYYFLTGIQPWHYYISWTSGTPTYYPESWFWLNYQEAVIALTYEDMNCEQAGEYDHTASALLNGIADYLKISTTAVVESANSPVNNYRLYQNYPNPFNPETTIKYEISKSGNVELNVFDVQGRKVADVFNGMQNPGTHLIKFNGSQLASGVYLFELKMNEQRSVKKMILQR